MVIGVMLMGLLCGGSAGADDQAGPILVTLSSPKSEYTFGETIRLTLTITNKSETTKALALGPVSGRSVYGLRIIKGKEGAQQQRHDVRQMTRGLLVLKPHESVNFLYSGLQLGPGDEFIHAEYQLAEAMIDPLEDVLPDVWTGKVTSNSLRLVVKEEPLTPEHQADFDRRMQRLLGVVRDSPPELRQDLVWYFCTYMPLTRDYLRAMLHDSDYHVRASAVWALCQLANPTDQTVPKRKDVSLLGDLLDMAGHESIPNVKQAIAQALGETGGSLDEEQKSKATAILGGYVERESGLIAGWAVSSLLEIDSGKALAPIRSKLARGGENDREFMNLLRQALMKRAGTSDVPEALRRIEQGQ
jgi:hypothetical protein